AVKVGSTRLDFTVRVPPADAAKLKGSVPIGKTIQPAELHRTTVASLDRTELNKETVATSKDDIAVIKAAVGLVGKAAFLKAKPEEVRLWMDRALKATESYGERMQLEVLLQLVEALNEQDGMANVT